MIVKPYRTFSYICTLDKNEEDSTVLSKLRSIVKEFNKHSDAKFRIELKGRLGKDNPNAQKYKDACARRWCNDAYSRIRLEDAAHVDVYVHSREWKIGSKAAAIEPIIRSMLKSAIS